MDKIASLKSLGRLASAITLGFLAYSSNACAAPDMYLEDSILGQVNWQVEPYIGADAFTRVMRYKSEPTHPFQEHLDTFQPFVGVRLHKYFGIEAGYQQSEKGTKERFFNPGEAPTFFGGGPLVLIDAAAPYYSHLDLNTTTAIKGWNIGLMAFYPICKQRTELFAKLGYAHLDFDAEYRFASTTLQTGNQEFSELGYGRLHKDTGLLHLGLGLKHEFARQFGGRLFINYEKTSRLRKSAQTDFFNRLAAAQATFGVASNRTSEISVKPRDSWNLGIGLYYTWK